MKIHIELYPDTVCSDEVCSNMVSVSSYNSAADISMVSFENLLENNNFEEIVTPQVRFKVGNGSTQTRPKTVFTAHITTHVKTLVSSQIMVSKVYPRVVCMMLVQLNNNKFAPVASLFTTQDGTPKLVICSLPGLTGASPHSPRGGTRMSDVENVVRNFLRNLGDDEDNDDRDDRDNDSRGHSDARVVGTPSLPEVSSFYDTIKKTVMSFGFFVPNRGAEQRYLQKGLNLNVLGRNNLRHPISGSRRRVYRSSAYDHLVKYAEIMRKQYFVFRGERGKHEQSVVVVHLAHLILGHRDAESPEPHYAVVLSFYRIDVRGNKYVPYLVACSYPGHPTNKKYTKGKNDKWPHFVGLSQEAVQEFCNSLSRNKFDFRNDPLEPMAFTDNIGVDAMSLVGHIVNHSVKHAQRYLRQRGHREDMGEEERASPRPAPTSEQDRALPPPAPTEQDRGLPPPPRQGRDRGLPPPRQNRNRGLPPPPQDIEPSEIIRAPRKRVPVPARQNRNDLPPIEHENSPPKQGKRRALPSPQPTQSRPNLAKPS